MKRSRFKEGQIIGFMREQEVGVATADGCRRHGISAATFSNRKSTRPHTVRKSKSKSEPKLALAVHSPLHRLLPGRQVDRRHYNRATAASAKLSSTS